LCAPFRRAPPPKVSPYVTGTTFTSRHSEMDFTPREVEGFFFRILCTPLDKNLPSGYRWLPPPRLLGLDSPSLYIVFFSIAEIPPPAIAGCLVAHPREPWLPYNHQTEMLQTPSTFPTRFCEYRKHPNPALSQHR